MTHQTATIRPAQPVDASGITICIDAAYAQYADLITDLPPVSEGCADDIANHHVWVAELGDKIVACVVLVPGEGFMKLENLAVHPDHGGTGLGRALISLSETAAKRQGFHEMRLNTHVKMPQNVSFYQRLGWNVLGQEDQTVMMAKDLPQG